MRYLVTGATGFLGAHLVARLEASGHEVVRFSRADGGDVLDLGAVGRAASGCDGAFHCAGKVSRRPQDAEALYRVHVDGTRTVLDACERAGVARVVFASTSGTVAVSEDARRLATERDPAPLGLIARWPYYRAKLFAEQTALARSRPGFEVVSVNPSLLMGPGDVRGSSTGDVRDFLEGRVHFVPSGGLSFVDARDAAEALVLALERGRGGQRYLIGACNVSVREFLARLSRVSGVRAPWLPAPPSRALVRRGAQWLQSAASRWGLEAPIDPVTADMAQHFFYLDASKAESELGWRGRDPDVTLLETVEDLRARGVVWPRDTASE